VHYSLFIVLIFYFIVYFYSLIFFFVYLYLYTFSISFNMPPTRSNSQSREIVSNEYKYMKEAGPTITVKNIGVEVLQVKTYLVGPN
jgi:hypothetical protein